MYPAKEINKVSQSKLIKINQFLFNHIDSRMTICQFTQYARYMDREGIVFHFPEFIYLGKK